MTRLSRQDKAWTLMGLAMELEGHVSNASEFLYTDREGRDVSGSVVVARRRLVLQVARSLRRRADRLRRPLRTS